MSIYRIQPILMMAWLLFERLTSDEPQVPQFFIDSTIVFSPKFYDTLIVKFRMPLSEVRASDSNFLFHFIWKSQVST